MSITSEIEYKTYVYRVGMLKSLTTNYSSKFNSTTAEVILEFKVYNIGCRLSLPIYEDKAVKWNSTCIKLKSSNHYRILIPEETLKF